MKTLVLREVDGRFFSAGGFGLLIYPNKYDGEQAALAAAAKEPSVMFRLATLSTKQYCVNPSTLWSTPDRPDAWRAQTWLQGWYELWQMKGDERHSMSSVLLVLRTPELGPEMHKHVHFNLDGSPGVNTSTNYRPIRAFKVQAPSFIGAGA